MCLSTDSPEGLENIPEKGHPQVKRFCPHEPIVLAGSEKDLGKDEPTGGSSQDAAGAVKPEEGERWSQDWRLGDTQCSAKTEDGGWEVWKWPWELLCKPDAGRRNRSACVENLLRAVWKRPLLIFLYGSGPCPFICN